MIRIPAGDLQISVLDAGRLWLDGGAMFGVVPRPLWGKQREPDDHNRIELAMNVLLVQDGNRTVLVDSGAGTDWTEKERAIYRLEPRSAEDMLAPAGLEPEDVDIVVSSHLHFDHAGGNTVTDGDGVLRPAFPEAQYVFLRGEIETATHTNERTRGSYLSKAFEPLLAEPDRVRVVDDGAWVTPWLELRVARGHTPDMAIAVLRGGDRPVGFLADLVPTASHVPYPWIMGYDLEPLETLAAKKRVLPEAHRDRWIVVFEHDARLPVAELIEDDGKLFARPAERE